MRDGYGGTQSAPQGVDNVPKEASTAIHKALPMLALPVHEMQRRVVDMEAFRTKAPACSKVLVPGICLLRDMVVADGNLLH